MTKTRRMMKLKRKSEFNHTFVFCNVNGHLSHARRERNRVLARETRQRKKFFFEVNIKFDIDILRWFTSCLAQSLQAEVQGLVKENNHLKALVNTLEPSVSEKIIAECCSKHPDIVATVTNEATSVLARADFSLISAICSAQRSFCISDPALPDNPLVFASQGFLDLTGYSMDEILGRNCRFLQGPATDLAGIAVLGEGLRQGVDTSVMLLNYKKDGTTFWNQIYASALRDSDDNIVNYVGVQIEVLPSAIETARSAGRATQEEGGPSKKTKVS